MIEFQADCGHVIQAEDHCAGRIVKCAYCGREVEVPPPPGDDPDLLFEEVDLDELARNEGHRTVTGLAIRGEPAAARAPVRIPAAPRPKPEPANLKPYLIVGYAAIAVAVLIIVGQVLISSPDDASPGATPAPPPTAAIDDVPTTTPDAATASAADSGDRRPAVSDSAAKASDSTPAPEPTEPVFGGLPRRPRVPADQGLLVHAVPDRARVYLAPSRDSRTPHDSEAWFVGQGRKRLPLQPGAYCIAVLLPLNDGHVPATMQSWLSARDSAETRVPESLLRRDASRSTHVVVRSGGGSWLARYYDVTISPGQWSLVTALFHGTDDLTDLHRALRPGARFDFDREDALDYLAFERVPEADHDVILDILARIGQLVYAHADGRRQILEVGLVDGLIQVREAPDLEPPGPTDPELAADDARQHGADSSSAPWGAPRRPGAAASDSTAEPPGQAVAESPPATDDHASAVPGPRNPWGPAKGEAAPPEAAARSALQQRVAALQRIITAGEVPSPEILRVDLRSPAWTQAPAATRQAWLALLTPASAAAVLDDFGGTMLRDPDLAVRLNMLALLRDSGERRAVDFIERRLSDLDADPPRNSADAAEERGALQDARSALLATSGGRNPWNR